MGQSAGAAHSLRHIPPSHRESWAPTRRMIIILTPLADVQIPARVGEPTASVIVGVTYLLLDPPAVAGLTLRILGLYSPGVARPVCHRLQVEPVALQPLLPGLRGQRTLISHVVHLQTVGAARAPPCGLSHKCHGIQRAVKLGPVALLVRSGLLPECSVVGSPAATPAPPGLPHQRRLVGQHSGHRLWELRGYHTHYIT